MKFSCRHRCWITNLLIFLSMSLAGQHSYELWTRLQVNHALSPRWVAAADLQWRRQDAPWLKGPQPLSQALLGSARSWLMYKCDANFSPLLSPIAYFGHTQVRGDQSLRDIPELRSAAGLVHQWKGRGLKGRNRLMQEARWFNFEQADSNLQWRSRFLSNVSAPLHKDGRYSLHLELQDEVLFTYGSGKQPAFDHNRFFSGLQLNMGKQEFHTGYQLSVSQPGNTLFYRHAFLINTILTL